MEEIYGPQIDWNRYHQLLSIQLQRKFNESEGREYAFYVPIVEELDRQELEEGKPALDRLDRLHGERLAKIDALIEKLKKK